MKDKKGFCVWKCYVRYLQKVKFPEKNLKWILQTYHNNHKKEYEAFKKNPKIIQK